MKKLLNCFVTLWVRTICTIAKTLNNFLWLVFNQTLDTFYVCIGTMLVLC